MKNTYSNFRKFLAIIIIFLIIIFSISSCGVLKKETNKESVLIKKTEIKNDSVSKIEVNKAIDDKAEIKVQESNTGNIDFDRKVNLQVDKILSAININKKSGENSYKLYYDLKAKMMKLEAQIGETKNENTATNNDTLSEKSISEKLTEELIKSKKPWWVYVLILYFFWPILKPILMMFLGPTNLLDPLSKILNKNKT